jgi:hypothetical protein
MSTVSKPATAAVGQIVRHDTAYHWEAAQWAW